MQNWKKLFNRVNWINRPSTATPIDQNNLNKSDSALYEIDNRVITLDTIKADVSDVNEMVSSVTLNESTGVLTINYKNGSSKTYNTNLQKLAVNFSYDPVNQRLVIELEDGSYQYVDMSALVTQYEFKDSSTIAFSVAENGSISASVKNGSITEAMLETGYLANIKVEVGKAKNYSDNAKDSETQSEYYSKMAMSYANGLSGLREGETVDNAKYYMEQAKAASAGKVTGVKGSAESTYRTGQVDITKGNIGLGNVDNTADADKTVKKATSAEQDGSGNVIANTYLKKTGDAKDVTVTYTSNDSTTAPDATPPAVMATGEKLSALLGKLSTFGKNVRWLLSKMGSTDISAIGDGTVTGAISTLNSNVTKRVVMRTGQTISMGWIQDESNKIWYMCIYVANVLVARIPQHFNC